MIIFNYKTFGQVLRIIFFTSCVTKIEKPQLLTAKFPIDFKCNKVLEFVNSIVPPKGGFAIKEDTFQVYSLTNCSTDTIWVKSIIDSNFVDSKIKVIYFNHIGHKEKNSDWYFNSESNGCWGGCNDSIKLFPKESTLFIMQKASINIYDSLAYDIILKIKKGLTTKDTIVRKKMGLNSHRVFVEDINVLK